jgi:hypothetical protein
VGIEFPEQLQWVAYLTGSAWPKGDESAMFRIGEDWRASAEELAGLIPDLGRVRSETMAVLSGATADAAEKQFSMLFNGEYSVDKLAEAMSALGELARNAGTEIEYTKLQILTSLAIAATEIAYAVAMAYWTFGGSLAWIPAIEAITLTAVRQVVVALVRRLGAALAQALTKTGVRKLIREAAEEVTIGVVQELGIQKYQAGEGHRDGIHWKQVGIVGGGSAVGGGAGGAAHGPLSHAFGDATSVAGKVAKGAVTHYGVGLVGNIAGSGATGGQVDGLSIFGGAASGAVSGGIHGAPNHPGGGSPEGGGFDAVGPLKTGPPGPFGGSNSDSTPHRTVPDSDLAGLPQRYSNAESPPPYSSAGSSSVQQDSPGAQNGNRMPGTGQNTAAAGQTNGARQTNTGGAGQTNGAAGESTGAGQATAGVGQNIGSAGQNTLGHNNPGAGEHTGAGQNNGAAGHTNGAAQNNGAGHHSGGGQNNASGTGQPPAQSGHRSDGTQQPGARPVGAGPDHGAGATPLSSMTHAAGQTASAAGQNSASTSAGAPGSTKAMPVSTSFGPQSNSTERLHATSTSVGVPGSTKAGQPNQSSAGASARPRRSQPGAHAGAVRAASPAGSPEARTADAAAPQPGEPVPQPTEDPAGATVQPPRKPTTVPSQSSSPRQTYRRVRAPASAAQPLRQPGEQRRVGPIPDQVGAPSQTPVVEGVPVGRIQTISDIRRWLVDINNAHALRWDAASDADRENNCGECAAAVFQRLSDGPSNVQAALGTRNFDQMHAVTGLIQVTRTPGQIADRLIQRGAGAHTVIGVNRGEGVDGHWLNAYYDGRRVYAIDGQSGTITTWPPNLDVIENGKAHPVQKWDMGVMTAASQKSGWSDSESEPDSDWDSDLESDAEEGSALPDSDPLSSFSDPEPLPVVGVEDARLSTPPYPPRSVLHGVPEEVPETERRTDIKPPTLERPSAQLDPSVDPNHITGVRPTPANPNGDTHFRIDQAPLVRDDSRDPLDIFNNGFAPRDPANTNLASFVGGDPGAFVSTTRKPHLNHLGHSGPFETVFRYPIDAPGGIDVNATLGDTNIFDDQDEVAFPGGIRRENIAEAERVGNGQGPLELWPFHVNRNFDPSAPNPHLPSQSEPTQPDPTDTSDELTPMNTPRAQPVPLPLLPLDRPAPSPSVADHLSPDSLPPTDTDIGEWSATQPHPPRSVLGGLPEEAPVTSVSGPPRAGSRSEWFDSESDSDVASESGWFSDSDSDSEAGLRRKPDPHDRSDLRASSPIPESAPGSPSARPGPSHSGPPAIADTFPSSVIGADGNPIRLNIPNTFRPGTASPTPPVPHPHFPSPQLNGGVDPHNITGLPAGVAPQFRTDGGFLFRDDHRPPHGHVYGIFTTGFRPRDANNPNLVGFVEGENGAFVSSTRHPNLAFNGPTGFRGGTRPSYRYIIFAPPAGIDVARTLPDHPFAYQQEIAFPGGIRRENIVGAQEVIEATLPPGVDPDRAPPGHLFRDLQFGPFIPNDHVFNPTALNPNVSPQPPAGRSLPTPPGDQPVLAAIPHSESTIDEVRGWVGDVNHVGDPSVARSGDRLLNCGPATVVVFHRLSGIASNARADLGNLTPDGVGEATGLGLVTNTRDGIAEYLVGEGPGAHTVVAVRYRDGQQHVFNAFYDGHGVYAVDGQRGTVQPWPPDLDRGANLVRAWFMGTPVHGDGSIFSHPGGTTDFPAGAHSGQRRLSSSDGVPESGVPQQGFAPRVVIAARVPAATAFVSTTRNPILNHLGSPEPDGPVFRYTIDAPGGFDVNRTQGLPRDTYQQEIAFPSAIRRENIIGAEEVPPREDPGGSGDSTTLRFGSFETNPHFNPDLPSAAPPPLGPVGDSSAPPSPALVELRFRTPSDFDDSDEPSSQLISPSHALDDESLSDTGVDDGRSSVPPYPTRSVLHSVPPENPVDEVGPAAEGSGHADGGSASRVFDPGTFGSRPPTPERPSAQLDPSVDPAKIHGVRPSNENVTAAVKFRTDNNPLFRDDTRSPDAVFTTGFAPRDPSNLDLLDHVSAGETGLVSTTRDPELNFLGRSAANGGQVFRFHIDAPGGVDVNPTLGGLGYTHQVEVAFPGGIRRENIKGAEQVLTATKRPATPTLKLADGGDFDVTVGPFIQNPNFNPSAPNTHLRRGPTQPAGASTSAGSDSETEFGPVLDIRAGAFASPGSDSAAEFGPVLDIRAGALGSPGSDSETDSAAEFGPVLDISAGAFASPWPHSTPPLSETRPVDAPPVPPKPGPSRARTGLVPPEAPAPHTLVATSGQSKALPQPTPPEATPPALDTHPEGSVAGRSDSALSYLSDRVIVSMAHGADDGPRSSADDDVPVPLPLLSHPAPPMNPGREAGAGNDLPFRDDTASAGSDVVPMSEGIVAQGDLAANLPVMGTSAGAGASLSRPLPSAAPSAHPAGLPVARTVDTAAPQSATRSGAHARVDAARSQQVGQHHGAAPPDDDLLRSPTPTLVKRRFVPGPPSGRSLPVRPDGSVGSIPDTSRYLRPPAAGGSGGVGGDASVGAGPPPSLSAEPSSVAAGTGVSSGSTDDPRPSRHDNSFLDMSPGPDDSFLDLGEDSP